MILSLAVLFLMSCDAEEYFEGTATLSRPGVIIAFPDGGGFEPFGLEVLTTDETFTVDVELSGPNASAVSSMEVVPLPSAQGTFDNASITISDGKGSFTGDLADFGLTEDGASVTLVFIESSTPSEKNFTVFAADPVPEPEETE
ncbi:hypothetical protein [Persicobacter sp. CCB-QB2]|uniref:hypothetical protein n=1 Tax=Persicobacter sp. CCB-QB2 TaxID=1561025 RepID=UPI0012F913FB|nr:hypothetical protein [Persicobacter sp. CCB-QB2]